MNSFTFKWYAKFVTSLLSFMPELKVATKLKNNEPWEVYKKYVDEQLHTWAEPLLQKAQVDFDVKGVEKVPTDEPIIYTPNHSSMFDIPAVALTAPKIPMFMAKKELSKIPVFKQWMWAIDCVFVDRSNKESAHSSLQQAIDMVNAGRSLVIFPEGTRSKDGKLGKFKGGAMKIAMETGAKVVPVLIEGSRDRLETTGNITPGTIHITYLDPIETKGLTKEDFFAMPDQIRELIQNERDKNTQAK